MTGLQWTSGFPNSYMSIFISTWALCAAGVVCALPMIHYRIKDHTDLDDVQLLVSPFLDSLTWFDGLTSAAKPRRMLRKAHDMIRKFKMESINFGYLGTASGLWCTRNFGSQAVYLGDSS